MRRILIYCKKSMFLPLLVIIFLVGAFLVDKPVDVFKGYYKILTCSSILVTDYIAVGGLGATLFNVATVTIFNLIIIRILDLRITGIIFSGLVCILGFSFFGKNIINTLPIYFGIYLFSRIKKIAFKNLIVTLLFSTGISPLVSYCIFGFGFPLYYGIPLGIVCGVIAGLIITPLANHTIKFHQGYDIYNTGFALGIVSVLFYGIFTTFKLDADTVMIVCDDYHYLLLGILIFVSVASIITAIALDRGTIKRYFKLMKKSGRLVSDFIRDFGRDTVILNFGILGILFTIILLILGVRINGAIFGTILAVLGFASSGLHLRNMFSVMLGAILSVLVTNLRDFDSTSVMLSIFFVSGLAPIAGKYGMFAGLFAGFIHVMFAPLALEMQGGFDLYNNGFASGFVACIVVSVLEAFKKEN